MPETLPSEKALNWWRNLHLIGVEVQTVDPGSAIEWLYGCDFSEEDFE